MYPKAQILVVGRHRDILETVVRCIDREESWKATGCLSNEAAKESFTKQHFDLVLLSNGISAECEQELTEFFRRHHPQVRIVQHYGGGSGLLYGEIRSSLERDDHR